MGTADGKGVDSRRRVLPPAQIRVIHVDDEPGFTDLVATFLEREDDRFVVDSATSARDGLDRLESGSYDCVVSDYEMPEMDGIEFLEAVRKEYPDLPFVLFTGKGSEAVASDAISAGVTDYLQKETGTDQYTVLANRITNAVGHLRAERELERQNDLFRKSQDLADAGPWEYDVRRAALTWTDEVYEIHDLSPETEIDPGEAIEFYHPEDRAEMREAFERALDGRSYDLELRLVTGTGGQRWVRTRGRPQTENGEVIRVRGTIQDITERKERERDLQRQTERFEEFAGVVSHDLETPLVTARSRIELALETGDLDHLADALAALDRVDELRDDLAEVLQTQELVEETTTVAPDDLARSVWETLNTGGGGTLRMATLPEVRADPTALKRALENLLSNALEHGGADVTVRVGAIEDGLFVADDGPGIPEDRREEVFSPGVSTAEGGTGMGLTSVQQVVHAHGWTIRAVESEDLGGARFEITGVDVVD